jgi:hypothetical protein
VKPKQHAKAVLLCAMIFCVFVLDAGGAWAQTTKSASPRQQQQLVKQVNKKAERFYKSFIRKNQDVGIVLNAEMNGHLEDLLLTIDGLVNPLYRRHNLIIAMRVASAIERLLLMADVSSDVVLGWADLHADLDLLAKLNGIKWSEAVLTRELIAALANDVDRFLRAFQEQVSLFQDASLKASPDLVVLVEDFRHSAQALHSHVAPTVNIRSRIDAIRSHSRLITESLNRHSITVELQTDWRRVTSQLEALVRLYNLDLVGAIQNLPCLNTLSALFTANHEDRNLHYCGGVL